MHTFKTILIAGSFALLMACAGPGTKPEAEVVISKGVAEIVEEEGEVHVDENEKRVVCRREHKVGSNRPIRTCFTVDEREEMRERSQDAMRRAGTRTGRADVQ